MMTPPPKKLSSYSDAMILDEVGSLSGEDVDQRKLELLRMVDSTEVR